MKSTMADSATNRRRPIFTDRNCPEMTKSKAVDRPMFNRSATCLMSSNRGIYSVAKREMTAFADGTARSVTSRAPPSLWPIV